MPRIFDAFRQKKSITLFTWPLILDAKVLKEFENETGIKVYISYYETNEELYSKFRQGGTLGYDLVIPTDYIVHQLIKDDLIQELDKNKLDFFNTLDPRVTNHYFDPSNRYSMPYFWGVYGLGINTSYFDGVVPQATWGLLFDQALIPAPIAMTDAPREAIMLAAQYLFGTTESLNDPDKVEQVKALLIKQKQWVQLYNEARTEDLLLGASCPIVTALSPDVWKVKQDEDDTGDIAFIRPPNSFVFIDSFVMPKSTKKADLVYQLLNFLYRPEIIQHHMNEYGFCSPVIGLTSGAPDVYCPKPNQMVSLSFFKDVVPLQVIDDIWVSVMAS
jgi:spermidine/putrescine transport system substrate-binding protein